MNSRANRHRSLERIQTNFRSSTLDREQAAHQILRWPTPVEEDAELFSAVAFDGLIDDVRVHDQALTADQLADGELFLFADSFESGNTSAWSDAVP